jgi:hypothetical protein
LNIPLLVTLLVFAFGAVFLYFVGAVIIQALRLSILQVKSDVKIKMDQHNHELEQQRFYLESKRLMLEGKTQEEETKQIKKKDITTIELAIDGEISGLKEVLESIERIKKFAIFKNSLLLDIEGDITPTQLIEEIENSKVKVSQVNFAKNPEKTIVKDKGN